MSPAEEADNQGKIPVGVLLVTGALCISSTRNGAEGFFGFLAGIMAVRLLSGNA